MASMYPAVPSASAQVVMPPCVLDGKPRLSVVLQWDPVATHGVDLDLSAVVFDTSGKFVESVYFGNLRSVDGALVHSGDSKDGQGAGDDETITIDLSRVGPSVGAIVLFASSYSGDDFSTVKTAMVLLSSGNSEMGRCHLGAQTGHTSFVVGHLVPQGGQWTFVETAIAADQRCFADAVPRMQESIRRHFPAMKLAQPGSIMCLTKGECVKLSSPGGQELGSALLGLGWDMIGTEAVDLDASALLFGRSHNLLEAVFFNCLRSRCGGVMHHGDNLTGAGEGDDEQISLNLRALSPEVHTIALVITSYRGHSLSMIKNAFVRLVDPLRRKEILRFNLGANPTSDTAMYMCRLTRRGGGWRLRTVGWSSRGKIYKDCVALVQRELRGARSNPGHEYQPAAADLFRKAPKRGTVAAAGSQLQTAVIVALVLLVLYLLTSGGGETYHVGSRRR